MRVGKYVWDVEPKEMSDEEFNFFCDGVENARVERRERKRTKYWNKLAELLQEAEDDGVALVFMDKNYSSTYLNLENCDAVML